MSRSRPIRLSIVTVCWNDIENVRRTVESLEVQSERQGWEHLLVDGASQDGTAEWYANAALNFPSRIISEPDNGIFDAMNKSIDMIRGDYVVFLNAGDRYADSGAVGRALGRIENALDWGYSRARVVDSSGQQVHPPVGRIPYSRLSHLLGMAKICHQAVIMRVELFRRLGGFDLRMGNAADYHLLVKAAGCVPPVTWAEIDVDYLAGGVSEVERHLQLRRRHRARVDALDLTPIGAGFDRAWTGLQLTRIRLTKPLKPVLNSIYRRLLN